MELRAARRRKLRDWHLEEHAAEQRIALQDFDPHADRLPIERRHAELHRSGGAVGGKIERVLARLDLAATRFDTQRQMQRRGRCVIGCSVEADH